VLLQVTLLTRGRTFSLPIEAMRTRDGTCTTTPPAPFTMIW